MIRTELTKNGRMVCVGIMLCLGVLAVASYASQVEIASVQAVSQGRTYGNVAYTPVGENGLRVDFDRASASSPVMATVLIDDGVADSPFVGDYVEAAINTISMQVSGSGHQPATAKVVLDCASRKWRCDIPFPTAPDTVDTVDLPLQSTDGWTAQGLESASTAEISATFGADLTAVEGVSIALLPEQVAASYPAQYYTVTDFVLVNDDGISSRPASLTPLEKAFIARFGYGYGSAHALTDEMKDWDEDGDGMADFMELWAENDEDYANSIFSAEDIEVVSDGVNITWSCVAGNTYTVLKADSLGGEFAPVDGATATAGETGYMTLSLANGDGGCYYRILKH